MVYEPQNPLFQEISLNPFTYAMSIQLVEEQIPFINPLRDALSNFNGKRYNVDDAINSASQILTNKFSKGNENAYVTGLQGRYVLIEPSVIGTGDNAQRFASNTEIILENSVGCRSRKRDPCKCTVRQPSVYQVGIFTRFREISCKSSKNNARHCKKNQFRGRLPTRPKLGESHYNLPRRGGKSDRIAQSLFQASHERESARTLF